MYFIQFSMLQMKERAKFMPENKVFGQAVGGEIRRLLLARKVYHPEEKNDILPQYSSEFIVYNDS